MVRFIHAADFHLDSPFSALPPERRAERRRESRELPRRLAEYANDHGADFVLLSGDLFDGVNTYRETIEALRDALGCVRAPVFIAPGNHDWYGPGSPYDAIPWPENVHVFHSAAVEDVELSGLNAVVHGAAFTSTEQREGLLAGFRAPEDGRVHIMVLHGEIEPSEARYNPVTRAEIEESGLAYLALGHIHKRGELRRGKTLCAWPGCPEGRGFDELGDKGFYEGVISDDGDASVSFVPLAKHRYEILEEDVTGKAPLEAVEAVLPDDTAEDLYRVILTGEAEADVDLPSLMDALGERFYSLELRDYTRPAEALWARAEEDSLRGLFLRNLRQRLEAADSEAERAVVQKAARFGLAALDHRDLG